MFLPDIELHEAKTLEEAAELRARYAPDVRLLAGGTDVLVDLKTGRLKFHHLVSINRIAALHGIEETGDGLCIGALTTVAQLHRSPIVQKHWPALLDATSQMANPQIRNAATVGGNIISAVPCADLPPILTVMSASVVLWAAGKERAVPLDSFFVDVRKTALGDDELLTAIMVPPLPDRFGAAYARFSLRNGNTIAVASVAAGLLLDKDDTVKDARLTLGAVAPTPKPVQPAGTALVGHPLDEEAISRAAAATMKAAEPICDVRGSAEFRREIVGVLTRRALATAHQRAKEARS